MSYPIYPHISSSENERISGVIFTDEENDRVSIAYTGINPEDFENATEFEIIEPGIYSAPTATEVEPGIYTINGLTEVEPGIYKAG